jgi:hypothetical protein
MVADDEPQAQHDNDEQNTAAEQALEHVSSAEYIRA